MLDGHFLLALAAMAVQRVEQHGVGPRQLVRLVEIPLASDESLLADHRPPIAAISCGAVVMGANSYIGNAPNFMVKAVVEEAGIRMPSIFGYMAWSCGILVPLFVLLTVIFFR